jgi:predicted nucleic acid-binding protein
VILVDTSIWIGLFRDSSDFNLEAIVDLEEVVTCLPVIQEVLQGFDEQSAYNVARASTALSAPVPCAIR